MSSASIELFSTVRGYLDVLEPELVNLSENRPDEYLEMLRLYGEQDLFFLLNYILLTSKWVDDNGDRKLMHPFVLERCRDVQAHDDCVVDIWSREHLKSTLKSYGRVFQRIALDSNITIGFTSNTLKLSLAFGHLIQIEAEQNEMLHRLWPEAFWQNPKRDAMAVSARWSLRGEAPALDFRRTANVKEPTLAFWGLDQALPTGPHVQWLHYDDAVTRESVTTEEQMLKTEERWKSSLSLGREGGLQTYAGTFYHSLDLYNHMRGIKDEDSGESVYTFRVIPAREPLRGAAVFYSEDYLKKKRATIGEKEWWCQWMCEPDRGEAKRFDPAWLDYYSVDPKDFHYRSSTYILVDPASEKKKSDFTAMWVVDIGPDGYYRVVDIVRDLLDPEERINMVLGLWEKWGHQGFVEVRYEEYGLQNDIFFLRREQEKQSKLFPITPVGGGQSKHDRITQMVKPLKDRLFLFPERLIRKCNYANGADRDMMAVFLQEEYLRFPLGQHDDMLDALSRIVDPKHQLVYPSARSQRESGKRDWYKRALAEQQAQPQGNWIA